MSYSFTFEARTEVREDTDWATESRTYRSSDYHVIIKRSDGRERHLYENEARDLMRLMGAPHCFREPSKMYP